MWQQNRIYQKSVSHISFNKRFKWDPKHRLLFVFNGARRYNNIYCWLPMLKHETVFLRFATFYFIFKSTKTVWYIIKSSVLLKKASEIHSHWLTPKPQARIPLFWSQIYYKRLNRRNSIHIYPINIRIMLILTSSSSRCLLLWLFPLNITKYDNENINQAINRWQKINRK